MLHGEEAKFVSLHHEQAICRDLECIRKMNSNGGGEYRSSVAEEHSSSCKQGMR